MKQIVFFVLAFLVPIAIPSGLAMANIIQFNDRYTLISTLAAPNVVNFDSLTGGSILTGNEFSNLETHYPAIRWETTQYCFDTTYWNRFLIQYRELSECTKFVLFKFGPTRRVHTSRFQLVLQ